MTIFRVFVAPAIRAAADRSEPATATVEGRMATQQRHDEGRLRLLSVGLVADGDGETLVYPVDKGSGATTSLVEADGVVAIDADTDYLDTGDVVTVQLFSPDVEPPALLGIGEADPALNTLLDSLSAPRYLPLGSREGRRRLRNGVPDVAVIAGPTDQAPDAVELGGWSREWGLVVPAGNPDDVTGITDLIDRHLRFVNRETTSGLRTNLANHVATLADDRDATRHDLVDAIDGFDRTVKGVESPARRVADGRCDVGLGLRATADQLDLGFVSVGTQPVTLYAASDRMEKDGITKLRSALETLPSTFESLSGYTFESS
jgi:molybdopterin molybdochelatase